MSPSMASTYRAIQASPHLEIGIGEHSDQYSRVRYEVLKQSVNDES